MYFYEQNQVTTTEMMKKIHKMVLDDRRLKARELADMGGNKTNFCKVMASVF